MLASVLVANRGEIACRVIQTLDRLGIRSVAVFTEVDAHAPHVAAASAAVALGPGGYLDAGQILEAARRTGAQAVHPGYGFLSENAAFAAACAAAGVVFIGPTPGAIEVMGDKIRARDAVAARGVPVVPGVARAGLTDAELADAIDGVGFPALVKPSAGGGGKGMHVVREPAEVRPALERARREAAAAFGDDTLFVERYVDRPRHIEVQVLADTAGTTVALGERECTLQRRHQKVIEEAPAVRLDPGTRARMLRDARETARAVGYVGAGTVEFLVPGDSPRDYWFLEMNTRLQVEHPVTELVTGIDLVEQQLRIAAGLPLAFREEDVRVTGHAVEARLYAEDPADGFLPTGGRVLDVALPHGEGIRVDGALEPGLVVPLDYDPMLAKVIAWAPDRDAAIARLTQALQRTAVLGPATNLPFLIRLLEDPEVRSGDLDTGLIERKQEALAAARPVPDGAALAALVLHAVEARNRAPGPWADLPGWRLGEPAPAEYRFAGEALVRIAGTATAASVQVGDAGARPAAVVLDGTTARIRLGGVQRAVRWAMDDGVVHLAVDGRTSHYAEEAGEDSGGAAATALPELRSPMPGTVVTVTAEDGEQVAAGTAVLVVEAMKMEHTVSTRLAGELELLARVGDRVARDQVLARIRTAPVDEEGAA